MWKPPEELCMQPSQPVLIQVELLDARNIIENTLGESPKVIPRDIQRLEFLEPAETSYPDEFEPVVSQSQSLHVAEHVKVIRVDDLDAVSLDGDFRDSSIAAEGVFADGGELVVLPRAAVVAPIGRPEVGVGASRAVLGLHGVGLGVSIQGHLVDV